MKFNKINNEQYEKLCHKLITEIKLFCIKNKINYFKLDLNEMFKEIEIFIDSENEELYDEKDEINPNKIFNIIPNLYK